MGYDPFLGICKGCLELGEAVSGPTGIPDRGWFQIRSLGASSSNIFWAQVTTAQKMTQDMSEGKVLWLDYYGADGRWWPLAVYNNGSMTRL